MTSHSESSTPVGRWTINAPPAIRPPHTHTGAIATHPRTVWTTEAPTVSPTITPSVSAPVSTTVPTAIPAPVRRAASLDDVHTRRATAPARVRVSPPPPPMLDDDRRAGRHALHAHWHVRVAVRAPAHTHTHTPHSHTSTHPNGAWEAHPGPVRSTHCTRNAAHPDPSSKARTGERRHCTGRDPDPAVRRASHPRAARCSHWQRGRYARGVPAHTCACIHPRGEVGRPPASDSDERRTGHGCAEGCAEGAPSSAVPGRRVPAPTVRAAAARGV